MSDLISRQDAIEVLEWFDQTDPLGYTPVQIVRALPTAEPSHDGFLEFLFNVINPNEMEQYMAMYNHKTGVKEAGND